MSELNYEQQVKQLKEKIAEFKELSTTYSLDMEQEIRVLEERIQTVMKDMYDNLTVWQKVQLARKQERPTTLDYIERLCTKFIECHGDRNYADDPAIIGGVAMFEGRPVTVIGHQKGKNTKENIYRRFGMPQPEGYRKALRLMKQANKFKRPILTFINTAGAYPGKEAEERGQSEAIARNLFEMAKLEVPVICIVIGEGGSGGALALGVGNRLLMLENSFYSVISPEGAAALLWKDAGKAKEAAETMKIGAEDLCHMGIVDRLIEEPSGGAHTDVDAQANFVRQAIREQLCSLADKTGEELVRERYEKFRQMGEFLQD